MSIDIEVLTETYSILKQYVPSKDRQEAADNLISVLVDMLDDKELAELGALDSYLGRAIKDYTGDADEDEYQDDD